MSMSMFTCSHNAGIKCLLLHWQRIQDSLNVGSRQHKVIQMGTEVILPSLPPEIKIKFLFHLMEAEASLSYCHSVEYHCNKEINSF